MFKNKLSAEDKVYGVNIYLDGKENQRRIASLYNVISVLQ